MASFPTFMNFQQLTVGGDLNPSAISPSMSRMNTRDLDGSSLRSMNMIDQSVLLIDDDADLLQLASLIFKRVGAQVITARDGLEGIGKLLTHRPNLILLDVMMPGVNGFEICQRIRKISNVPIIMLTALDHEQNLLQGLEAGADDYLSKPFNVEVLLTRVKALLRRSQHGSGYPAPHKYSDGRLEIDSDRHHFLINGKRVKSTPIEFRLLDYLERNAGRTLTYDQILETVWGEEYQGSIDVVYVYISQLRSKIEKNPRKPRYIKSVHGVGYIFER
jgi:DNA-binding response OmpR family regulator